MTNRALGDYVWYKKNANGQTHPVKSKPANTYGIYRGSVWEWVGDWYDRDYAGSVGLDPTGPALGWRGVIRGGGFGSDIRSCRLAYRGITELDRHSNALGFRLVRTKK